MEKVMVIGAGAIGKGVIVPLFLKHEMKVTIVNRTVKKIVNPDTNRYSVYDGNESYPIQGFKHCGFQYKMFEDDFLETDILVITLRDGGLEVVFPILAKKLKERCLTNINRKLTILICSNQRFVQDKLNDLLLLNIDSEWLKTHIEILHVLVYVGAAPYKDSYYDIVVNTNYGRIEMETSNFSDLNLWSEISTVEHIENHLLIKLALINRVQLYLALMGTAKNYTIMIQCLQDKDIYQRAKASYEECCHALVREYPDDMEDSLGELLWHRVLQGEYELLERFLHSIDRKLQENERIMIPVRLAEKYHLPCTYMKEVISLARKYEEKK